MKKKLKELFLEVMNFVPCERTVNWEYAYWGGVLNRWYKEGLPKVYGPKNDYVYGDGILGGGCIGICSPSYGGGFPKRDKDVKKFFNFDKDGIVNFPYYYWVYPFFERKIIFENENYIELIDVDGIRKKEIKDHSSMPLWLEYPVKNRKDWGKFKKERFSFDSINKRFIGDLEEYINEIRNTDKLIGLFDLPVGFFGSLRSLIGEKDLYLMYYDDPKLIKDILGHLCNLWISIAEELTSKIKFDIAIFWEDMAGKNGSLISPNTFREFMYPYYKKLINFLREKGIELFLVDTDGRLDGLIPQFLEVGLNMIYPFEQQADNDLIEYRKKYPKLRMLGGFDKNSLYKGKEYIDKELEKMPWLIKKGGYIPYCDHSVPPNASFENFKYYREKLEKIIYSTKVTIKLR